MSPIRLLGVVATLMLLLSICGFAVTLGDKSAASTKEPLMREKYEPNEPPPSSNDVTKPIYADLPKVDRRPPETPEFFNGINLLWYRHPGTPSEVIEHRSSELADYVQSLHANSVMITYPLFIDGFADTEVYESDQTPKPAELKTLVDALHERGLYVVIRPVLDEVSLVSTGHWRGTLRPADEAEWFAGYEKAILRQASRAELLDVEELVIGVELSSLDDSEHWSSVSMSVRRVFSGDLSYSANWDAKPLLFDQPGVDAYFPIDLPDSATQTELDLGWVNALDRYIQTWELESVVLHEVGIPSTHGIYRRPWKWDLNQGSSPGTQANWFRAACRAAHELDAGGIYFWKLDFDHDFDRSYTEDTSDTFAGKPAEDVIRSCFQMGTQSSPTITGPWAGQ